MINLKEAFPHQKRNFLGPRGPLVLPSVGPSVPPVCKNFSFFSSFSFSFFSSFYPVTPGHPDLPGHQAMASRAF